MRRRFTSCFARPVAPPAWVTLLAVVPLLGVLYLLLPAGSVQTVAYPLLGLVATAAILMGVHLHPPARPGSWRLIALAFALFSVGDVAFTVLAFGSGPVAYPSVADVVYLAGYMALIGGVIGLVRGRVGGRDRTAIIDAAILSAGAGSAFWVAIIRPNIDGEIDRLAALVSMAYPALDLVLLAVGLRVLVAAGPRPRYIQFLLGGTAFYFVADVIYAIAMLNGPYVGGQLVNAGWIVGALLIGVAALHPSIADPIAPVAKNDERLSRGRLAVLAAAALIAPTILLIVEIGAGDDVAIGLVVEWTVLFALVFLRFATTVSELTDSLQERRRLQGDLAHQATHDSLTGLGNRLLFEERLTRAVTSSPETTALIFMDLDDFKTINDTLGHPAGDDMLRILAGRLERGLRSADLAVRLGGDEFAILVEGNEHPAEVQAVAERALASLRAPVNLLGRRLLVHASAGIALGHAGSTAVDLMQAADVAMYQAKSHGKDQVEMYEAEMHGRVVRSYEVRTELAEAIASESFVLHYQPVIDLGTGDIAGAEALVRWNHSTRGQLGPHEFIPQAESSGLIHPLGRWILREACMTAARWPLRPDGERPSISVNLAASQLLEPDLVRHVTEVLARTRMPPHKLILEVTESALVDLEPARDALLRLRGLGIRLALDDFGTGYSALNYLAKLPFDIVKIDKSFIAGTKEGHGDALLQGILALCDGLELLTVAEGIEEPSQLARVRALGCRFGQGYHFARPLPDAEFAALLPPPIDPPRPSAILLDVLTKRVPRWAGQHTTTLPVGTELA